MSRSIGRQLPEFLRLELQSKAPPLEALPLITRDEEGFPHAMLLSFHEVLFSQETLYLLIPGSATSARNISSRPKVLLQLFRPEATVYIKGTAERVLDHDGLAVFRLDLYNVLLDEPTEEEMGAHLTSGLAFATVEADLERRTTLRQKIQQLLED